MITFLELANMVDATQDVGWGGGGMITFPELANMVDATQDVGWGGGGMITFPELANMVDATQDVGWGGGGMITFPELANMVDATQDVGWGGGGMITFPELANMGKMLGGVGGDDNVALKTLCRNTAQCKKKGPVASSLEHQNDTFCLIERIVTTVFNCFSPCKCDDIVSRSSNNANTHSSEHSMHIRTKHMSTKHHGHLHAVYLVVSS